MCVCCCVPVCACACFVQSLHQASSSLNTDILTHVHVSSTQTSTRKRTQATDMHEKRDFGAFNSTMGRCSFSYSLTCLFDFFWRFGDCLCAKCTPRIRSRLRELITRRRIAQLLLCHQSRRDVWTLEKRRMSGG